MYRNAQRSFNGGNEYYMEPSTLKKKNGEEDSPGDFSLGLLDLYSFDTELFPELVMLLWSYFSVVLTDSGSVPPKWRPTIDEERGEADPLVGSEFNDVP